LCLFSGGTSIAKNDRLLSSAQKSEYVTIMKSINEGTVMLAAAGAGACLGAWVAFNERHTYDLHNRVVLITGGSRGLGLALAHEFAREGAHVVICGRDEATVKRAQAKLAEFKLSAFGIPCDVTDREQVKTLVRRVCERFRRIDVLVNNAGTITVGPLDVMTRDDYEEAMNLHFWAPLYTTLAVLPDMRRRGEGRVVNIASIGGKVGVPHLTPYSASKFALVGLSQAMRAELAKDGICVTTVCPGLMRTGSPRNALFKGRHRDEYAWFSISDSLPFLSMSAKRAARQIVSACKRSKAEVVLSVPAQLAVTFHQAFPELSARVLAGVNRLLPVSGGEGTNKVRGRASASSLSPSILTTLGERAARRYNQVAPRG
jgi:short-subunit dehydrogenase